MNSQGKECMKKSPTCKSVRLKGSQAWKQVENGHLDERVFTGLVFQHPPTHLEKAQYKTVCQL